MLPVWTLSRMPGPRRIRVFAYRASSTSKCCFDRLVMGGDYALVFLDQRSDADALRGAEGVVRGGAMFARIYLAAMQVIAVRGLAVKELLKLLTIDGATQVQALCTVALPLRVAG